MIQRIKERRNSMRIPLDEINLTVFSENTEINGTALDISRGGISFETEANQVLKVGDEIQIQFFDSFTTVARKEEDFIVTGNAKIIRKSCRNNRTVYGCKLKPTARLVEYLNQKEIVFSIYKTVNRKIS